MLGDYTDAQASECEEPVNGDEILTFENKYMRNDIGKAQSKANKIAWNRIDYNNAKTVSENVVSTDYVQSGLITGTQWDTMLTFLSQNVNVANDSTSWGNYYNNTTYSTNANGKYATESDSYAWKDGSYNKGRTLLL